MATSQGKDENDSVEEVSDDDWEEADVEDGTDLPELENIPQTGEESKDGSSFQIIDDSSKTSSFQIVD